MKKLLFILLGLSISVQMKSQNVGINEDGATPDASAALDVDVSNKGFLMPRLTTAQRDAINGGTFANSLFIFNTDEQCFQAYIGGIWQNVFCNLNCSTAPAQPGAITGNASPAQNETGVVYSIAQVAGASSYNWSVPAGATIVSGQGTTSIIVDFGTTNGNVQVIASNSCGSSVAQTLAITLLAPFTGCIFTSSTQVVDVTSPTTAKVWMDRNLGASQVATAFNDANAYGCLYQWGRAADGHEDRGSGLIATLATTAVPNLGNSWDGLFITDAVLPYDWLQTQDNTLWQGVNGTNNPCPSGYRLPTNTELNNEQVDFINTGGSNRDGAFGSFLKIPSGGLRGPGGGLVNVGTVGYLRTSSIHSGDLTSIWYLVVDATSSNILNNNRADGMPIRCIKN